MNVTFILLGIIGVVYGTLLVGIEFRKWRARIHCRVPVDAVFEKTVTKKMGDRVRTYALFSYHYQEKKFRQCTMERITRKEKKSLEKGKIYTIRINEENPKKLCYLRKNFQMEDLLTFMGAGNAAMRIMEQRMYNDMRNKTNRLSNCETANMGKTVQAAVQVRLAIETLEEAGALETLPKPLQQAARLRMQYPEMPLAKLAEKFDPPVSKAGLSHRFKRIQEAAARLNAAASAQPEEQENLKEPEPAGQDIAPSLQ